ncbi:MAG TPA: zinc ribbon domain-containing protein [Firmicutes bacterium]|nr:zinc ribbon domain-containing protein [Bacillota bacterium]
MPSYEFICRHCQERFTVMIPYSQKKEVRCPQCKSDNLREVYGLGLVTGGQSTDVVPPSGGCSFG